LPRSRCRRDVGRAHGGDLASLGNAVLVGNLSAGQPPVSSDWRFVDPRALHFVRFEQLPATPRGARLDAHGVLDELRIKPGASAMNASLGNQGLIL